MRTTLLALWTFAALGQTAVAAVVDVYLLAGQSNMQGLGQIAELADDWQAPLPDVWFWTGEDFATLDPATTRLSSRPGEFGPELGFAKGLRALGCEAPLYLVKFHRSGQPLHHGWDDNCWLGGEPAPGRANFYPGASADDANRGSHYRDWLAQCQAALATLAAQGETPVLRGVVWMQGEQDSKHAVSASQYAASLRQLRQRLGQDLAAPDLPWVYGQVLPHEPALSRFAHRTEIRAQLQALDARSGLPDATPGMRMTPTEDMPLLPDAVHYNTEGQRRLGLAFADDMHRLQFDAAAATARDAPPDALADQWQFVGIAVNEPGWHIWGSSPIVDEAGRVHLFCARWPVAAAFDPGWRTHSQIARYTADSPAGPFAFQEVVLAGDGTGWDAQGVHNPNIQRVGDRFALCYIANDGLGPHGPNQRIGMVVADALEGPWTPANGDRDAPLLAPPDDPAVWCHRSGCGVNNPALLAHPDGRLLLYFKAKPGPDGHPRMGVAVAERLGGPYAIQPAPITANQKMIEDGYAFLWQDRVCLLTTDNFGLLERGGGLLWHSADGLAFAAAPVLAFHRFGSHYAPAGRPAEVRHHYTEQFKFERPALLMRAGEPEFLYAPSGAAIDGSDGTNCYVLRRTTRQPATHADR